MAMENHGVRGYLPLDDILSFPPLGISKDIILGEAFYKYTTIESDEGKTEKTFLMHFGMKHVIFLYNEVKYIRDVRLRVF